MQQLVSYLSVYAEYITLAMIGMFLIAVILFLVVIIRLNKIRKQYQILLQGMENKNLEEIILSNAKNMKNLEGKFAENRKSLEQVQLVLNSCIKNIKLKRYNAFDGVGGEQSFSLALLDDNGNGVVLSSIHGREDARTYAKKIINGNSEHHLSQEEIEVINEAGNRKF